MTNPFPFRFGATLAGLCLMLTTSAASAQGRHFPLNQHLPTGTAGRWSVLTKPGTEHCSQLIRISVPSQGTVTFYAGSPRNAVVHAAPAQAGMLMGRVYRVRIADMPEYPGVELFPTIEILDRLHPPGELAAEFPVPIELTEDEIDVVLQDRMLTKVIYLEEPDFATPVEQVGGILTEKLEPSINLLQAADLRGRPMAILRLGGRIPDVNSPADEFFSQSPILLTAP